MAQLRSNEGMEECTEGLRRQWEEAVPKAGSSWRSWYACFPVWPQRGLTMVLLSQANKTTVVSPHKTVSLDEL